MQKVRKRTVAGQRRASGRLIWGLGIAFAVFAVLSIVLVFNTVRGLASAWTGTGLPSFSLSGLGPSNPPETGGPAEGTASIPTPVLDPAGVQPWSGSERVSILLMGLDYRDWEKGEGPPRTDSMMLVTMDPVAQTAGMLSIPRDLWVQIPGFDHNRINTAYFLGEGNRLPGGGPGLAVDTVETLLGVPIQFYAVIDFHAFERMIDEIGGIDILVREPMRITPIGGLGMTLEAKAYHFNGPQALAYARARKTEGGDFDRARRQQQVAMAVRDRILTLGNIPVLITKAPALYSELAAGLRTNLSFDQMLSLGLLAIKIPPDSIRRGVIGPPDRVTLEKLPDGAEVLRPVPEQIRILRDEIFTATSAIGPSIPLDNPLAAAKLENARLAVLNGAGIEGLASATADRLKALGLNVVVVGNADRLDYEKSRLYVHSPNFPYTLRYLSSLAGLSESQVLFPVTPDPQIDVAFVLGADFDPAAIP